METDVKSKNHIRPEKKDGTDPGKYSLPDSQFHHPTTKFNKDVRKGFAPKDNFPPPNVYSPKKFTESSHQYTFP
jgi:hypothetical protein